MKITIQTKTDSKIHELEVENNQLIKDFRGLHEKYKVEFQTCDAIFVHNDKELNPEKSWSENGVSEKAIVELYFLTPLPKIQPSMMMAAPMPMNLLGGGGGYTF